MKSNTLQIIVLISALFLMSCLNEKIVFFEGIDFDSGNYKILVYGTEGEWIEDYRDFYIDDIRTLKRMKRQWVFRWKSDVMPCGYGYNLLLVNQSEIIKQTSINIDCGYMKGWIRFPKRYLSAHKSSFKRMTDKDHAEFSKIYFQKK